MLTVEVFDMAHTFLFFSKAVLRIVKASLGKLGIFKDSLGGVATRLYLLGFIRLFYEAPPVHYNAAFFTVSPRTDTAERKTRSLSLGGGRVIVARNLGFI